MAVKVYLLRQHLDALAQQVSQHVSTHLTCKTKGLGGTCRSKPDWQLVLDRPRQRFDSNLLTIHAGENHLLTAPETTHCFNATHRHLFAMSIILRRKQEVVSVPARSERDSYPAFREIVDNGPFLGDSHRMMKRQHDTAGPDLDSIRNRCDGSARYRGIWEEAAEGMEVTLRSPDGLESVLVGKFRAFD